METCHHCGFAASGYDAVAYRVVAERKPPPMATLPVGQTTVTFTMLPGPTSVADGGLTVSRPERPAGPIGPGTPAAPLGPVAPCGPAGPVAPSAPSEPLQLEVRRREERVNAERKAGDWKFFWLVPYDTVRNFLALMLVPPGLFLLARVAARLRRGGKLPD